MIDKPRGIGIQHNIDTKVIVFHLRFPASLHAMLPIGILG